MPLLAVIKCSFLHFRTSPRIIHGRDLSSELGEWIQLQNREPLGARQHAV